MGQSLTSNSSVAAEVATYDAWSSTPSRSNDGGAWPFVDPRVAGEALYRPSPHNQPSAMVLITDALSAWRAAERDLSEHTEAGPERTRIQLRLKTLRATYHQLFDERLSQPDPPVELVLFPWEQRLN